MKAFKSVLFAIALSAFALPTISYAQPAPYHQDMRANMASVRSALNNATFSSDKLVVIDSLVSSGNLFTCDNVREIITLMTFGDDQATAAIKLYPNTIDKNNWYTIYDAFTFDSTKDQVRKAVESMSSSTSAPVARPVQQQAQPAPVARPVQQQAQPAPVARPVQQQVQPAPATRPAQQQVQPAHTAPDRPDMRANMASVRSALDNATFSSDKLVVIDSLVSSGNLFTCDNVREIITLMRTGDDQATAAIKLYPNTIDKNNWYTIYDAFTFDSTKDQVRKAIESKQSSSAQQAPAHARPAQAQPSAPMAKPRADINGVLRALDNESFDSGKQAIISAVASTNSFTCAEVALIIKKMTFSDGQFFAATTLYNSTIDKNNWYTIYEAVTYSSTKDKIKEQLGL